MHRAYKSSACGTLRRQFVFTFRSSTPEQCRACYCLCQDLVALCYLHVYVHRCVCLCVYLHMCVCLRVYVYVWLLLPLLLHGMVTHLKERLLYAT